MAPPIEVLILGAGPHALTLAAELCDRDPAWGQRLVAVDPAGCWMNDWNARFDQLEITHLRSPTVHHPHPDPHAISRRRDLQRNDLTPGGYQRPSRRVFDLTVEELIESSGLNDSVIGGRVQDVRSDGDLWVTHLDDGRTLSAEHLVLATNRRRATIPTGVRQTAAIPDVRDVTAGERVVVIGGGLTAVQLADQVLTRDGFPIMVTRRTLVERHFDVDPGWMGPKYLDGFERIADPTERVLTARSARGGGTVPPGDLERLRREVESGRVELHEGNPVERAETTDTGACVHLADGRMIRADRVVAATGSLPSVDDDPIASQLVTASETDVVCDVPVLDDHLRLPGTTVYVTGGLATVQLGPAAGNLAGARRSAKRIAASLCGGTPMIEDPGTSSEVTATRLG